jgi:diaminopimelate epimerase
MKIRFSKMQGAGNDFVVLDETKRLLNLSPAQYRWLANRHFGVGADQILSIRAPTINAPAGTDFSYVIHNNDGNEVEHCGNGARCFVRYVTDKGLSQKSTLRVQTVNRTLELHHNPDCSVTVDMGQPEFGANAVAFDTVGLLGKGDAARTTWQLRLGENLTVTLAMVSMGNPHAVQVVADTERTPVQKIGPLVSTHVRFAHGVNAGFMQIESRKHIRLRVYERGAGETLACGTGACAAVVAGIRLGLLDSRVDVITHGGNLTIEWEGMGHPVRMTGPATFVFEGEIDLPDL